MSSRYDDPHIGLAYDMRRTHTHGLTSSPPCLTLYVSSYVVRVNRLQVNRHGTREQRVVGIDRDKMYNMRQQHALGVTVASMIMGAGMGRRDDARALIRYEDKSPPKNSTSRARTHTHSRMSRSIVSPLVPNT